MRTIVIVFLFALIGCLTFDCFAGNADGGKIEQTAKDQIAFCQIKFDDAKMIELIAYEVKNGVAIFAVLASRGQERILICDIDTAKLHPGDVVSNDMEIKEMWKKGRVEGYFPFKGAQKFERKIPVLRCWEIGTYNLQLALGSTVIRKYTASEQKARDHYRKSTGQNIK